MDVNAGVWANVSNNVMAAFTLLKPASPVCVLAEIYSEKNMLNHLHEGKRGQI